eukprot:2323809-Pleurochrysis_carterae.AAC.2
MATRGKKSHPGIYQCHPRLRGLFAITHMYSGTREELLEHAFKPYPSPQQTIAWSIIEQELLCELDDNRKSLTFSCMSKILSPIQNFRSRLSLDEQNVVFVRKNKPNEQLPCDVGVRTTPGELTLCYMVGVHMCDINFPKTLFAQLSAAEVKETR